MTEIDISFWVLIHRHFLGYLGTLYGYVDTSYGHMTCMNIFF